MCLIREGGGGLCSRTIVFHLSNIVWVGNERGGLEQRCLCSLFFFFWYSQICMVGGTVHGVGTSKILVTDWPLPWIIMCDGCKLTNKGVRQVNHVVYSSQQIYLSEQEKIIILTFQKQLRECFLCPTLSQGQIGLLLDCPSVALSGFL